MGKERQCGHKRSHKKTLLSRIIQFWRKISCKNSPYGYQMMAFCNKSEYDGVLEELGRIWGWIDGVLYELSGDGAQLVKIVFRKEYFEFQRCKEKEVRNESEILSHNGKTDRRILIQTSTSNVTNGMEIAC